MKAPARIIIYRGFETDMIFLEDLRGMVRNSWKDRKLTWKVISEVSTLHPGTISKFACGETKRPVFRTVFKLMEALDVKLTYR